MTLNNKENLAQSALFNKEDLSRLKKETEEKVNQAMQENGINDGVINPKKFAEAILKVADLIEKEVKKDGNFEEVLREAASLLVDQNDKIKFIKLSPDVMKKIINSVNPIRRTYTEEILARKAFRGQNEGLSP